MLKKNIKVLTGCVWSYKGWGNDPSRMVEKHKNILVYNQFVFVIWLYFYNTISHCSDFANFTLLRKRLIACIDHETKSLCNVQQQHHRNIKNKHIGE